jgi:hypothetical protein
MEPIITTLLTLGAAGAGAAGVRYLWRLASGGASEHERLQAQVLIEHARHQHPLPPQSYAPHIILTHNPQYAPRITRSNAAPVPPLVENTPTAAAPTFADLLASGQIGQGCPIVVGQSPTGLLTATWSELYSTAIGGLSGSGKSWTAASLVAQSLLNGASVALVDPDARDPNSLSARIAPLASRFVCDPTEEEPQIASLCALLTDELEARSKGTRERRPLVVAIDEYNDLVRHVPALAALVDLIGRRGRRQHMFALCLSHQWQGKRTGGSDVRDVFASAFIHRLRPAQARMLTGLTTHELPDDVLQLPEGHAYLLNNRGQLERITVPHTTPNDIAHVAGLLEATSDARPAAPPADVPVTCARPATDVPPAATSAASASDALPPDVARVLTLFSDGLTVGEIAQQVYEAPKSGGRSAELRRRVEEIIRQAYRAAAA